MKFSFKVLITTAIAVFFVQLFLSLFPVKELINLELIN